MELFFVNIAVLGFISFLDKKKKTKDKKKEGGNPFDQAWEHGDVVQCCRGEEEEEEEKKRKGKQNKKQNRQVKQEARRRGERGGQRASHCCQEVVLASSWKPGSEYLERMMSLGDPNIRLHSTIRTSRGSLAHNLKNLLVSGRASLSLMTAKESEWKITRAKRCQ